MRWGGGFGGGGGWQGHEEAPVGALLQTGLGERNTKDLGSTPKQLPG